MFFDCGGIGHELVAGRLVLDGGRVRCGEPVQAGGELFRVAHCLPGLARVAQLGQLLVGLVLGVQLLEVLLYLGQLRRECLEVHFDGIERCGRFSGPGFHCGACVRPSCCGGL